MATTHEKANELRDRIGRALRGNWLSRAQVQERFGISTMTARRMLESLKDAGLAVSRGEGKERAWTALEPSGAPTGAKP